MNDTSGDPSETPRLKALFVCPYSPYPLNFGGAIRVYNLMQTVNEFSDVSLICRTDEDQLGPLEDLGGWCDEVVFVEPEPKNRAALQRRSVLGLHSFLYLDHVCERFQRQLTDLLNRHEFDVIVIEHTQMSSYDLGDTAAVTVLDLHNIEHELVRRRAAVSGRGPRRVALELEWRKLRREELDACGRYELVFATSDREKTLLEGWVPGANVVAVPNTVEPSRFGRRLTPVGGRELLFVGLTHVDANRDGVCWFVEEIFPSVQALVPDVQLTIVGGNPPAEIADLGHRPNIEVTGWVPDVAPYLERATVSIVPLRSGGGTRLKVLESLGAGVPTVSTTIGAEGLDLAAGVDLLIVDDPSLFATSVADLLLNHDLQSRLAAAGARVVDEKYSWRAQQETVETALRTAIARSGP